MDGIPAVISKLFKHIFEDTIDALKLTPWTQIWEKKLWFIIGFSALLLLIASLMIFKDRLSKNKKLLNLFTYATLIFSFVYAGLIVKAQPAVTNLTILLGELFKEGEFPIGLYILEPYIFLSFLFITLTVLIWGRGVFCGWLCPYGAMTELLNKIYIRFFPKLRWNFPEKIHWKLIYLKYIIFAVILGVSFYNFMLSEYIAEIEPFKTFVLKMNRQWYYVLYFLVITAASMVVYRAYCRYLCPLGAALSIPTFIKWIPLVKLKRHDLCGTCKLCGKECGYNAITPEGRVNSRECMDCLECQVNFWDEDRCPALKRRRKKEGAGQAVRPLHAAHQEVETTDINESRETAIPSGSELRSSDPKLFVPLILASFLLFPHVVDAKTLVVGGEYSTISDALKKARDGDVIEVKAGEYRERLRIEKAVHLKGINYPVVIGQDGSIIEVTSPRVTIEGFTIKDDSTAPDIKNAGIYISKGADEAVIRGNRLYNVTHGIWTVGTRGVKIENNIIESKKALDRNFRGNGIYLTDSQEAVITGNKMDYCRDGMYIEVSHDARVIGNEVRNSRYAVHTMWVDRAAFEKNTAIGNMVGVAVMYSRGSTISDNLAVGNQTHGLLLIQAARSQIAGNTVSGNSKGIFLYNSVFNNITANLIMHNSLGLHSSGGSDDNSVNGNSFISNEVQVKFVAGRNQKWDKNYWSDYIGWDMTGDGVGDLPYESNTVVDHILWRYPAAKLLYTSPSFQLLWMLEKQFPILKVPRVLDTKPSMLPLHKDWRELMAKYPQKSEKYYGEIEKLTVTH